MIILLGVCMFIIPFVFGVFVGDFLVGVKKLKKLFGQFSVVNNKDEIFLVLDRHNNYMLLVNVETNKMRYVRLKDFVRHYKYLPQKNG